MKTFPNFASADGIMTTYLTTRRPHAGYGLSSLALTNTYNLEYFSFLSIKYFSSQSIEYFMVDWWVDLWAVIHGWPTVILLTGPGHPCRRSANGCQCKCYGRIIQIHALVPFLVKCTCISHTCVYILCTYSIRAHIYKIYTLFIWSGIDGRIIIEQIYGTHTPYSPIIDFLLGIN